MRSTAKLPARLVLQAAERTCLRIEKYRAEEEHRVRENFRKACTFSWQRFRFVEVVRTDAEIDKLPEARWDLFTVREKYSEQYDVAKRLLALARACSNILPENYLTVGAEDFYKIQHFYFGEG